MWRPFHMALILGIGRNWPPTKNFFYNFIHSIWQLELKIKEREEMSHLCKRSILSVIFPFSLWGLLKSFYVSSIIEDSVNEETFLYSMAPENSLAQPAIQNNSSAGTKEIGYKRVYSVRIFKSHCIVCMSDSIFKFQSILKCELNWNKSKMNQERE